MVHKRDRIYICRALSFESIFSGSVSLYEGWLNQVLYREVFRIYEARELAWQQYRSVCKHHRGSKCNSMQRSSNISSNFHSISTSQCVTYERYIASVFANNLYSLINQRNLIHADSRIICNSSRVSLVPNGRRMKLHSRYSPITYI